MSEPWMRQDSWAEELQFNSTMSTAVAGNAGNPSLLLSASLALPNTSTGSGENKVISAGAAAGALFPPFAFGEGKDSGFPRPGLYNAEHRLGYSALETSLPHMLDQYAAIYNKNGRIGIYTREVRSAQSLVKCPQDSHI